MTSRASDQAVVLQAASVCLQYPDDALRSTLPLVRRAVDALPDGRPRERLTTFLDAAAEPLPAGSRSTTWRCSTSAAAAAST